MGKKIFVLKPTINKRNNQISVNLPRKKLPKELVKKISDIKNIKLWLEGWD